MLTCALFLFLHPFRCCITTPTTDLALYPVDKWKDKGWDFIDSLDPKREWEGFSYCDMPDPMKGQEVSLLLCVFLGGK